MAYKRPWTRYGGLSPEGRAGTQQRPPRRALLGSWKRLLRTGGPRKESEVDPGDAGGAGRAAPPALG
jgi:hypothetical protein